MPMFPAFGRVAPADAGGPARRRLFAILPGGEPAAGRAADRIDQPGGRAGAPEPDLTGDRAVVAIGEATGEATGPARLGIDIRAAAVLGVLALLGALLGAWLLWQARPVAAEIPPSPVVASAAPDAGAAPAGLAAPAPTPPPELVVDVQGAVRRPGVVRLAVGSRVLDALAAAGGPRSGASTAGVNLARVLVDGEQVVLAPPGSAGAVAPAPAASGPGGVSPPVPLDLNTATHADLDALPGVGPVLAQRILDFRTAHGRYTSVEELQEVPGIGPATYDSLRARVRV